MRTLEIKKNDANQRLDKFLQKRFKTLPKSLMYKYIRKKCIKVNGKKCDIQTMLKEGDVLTFYIKDEFFEASEQKNYEFMKAPKTFDIVYEDENLILIDKKPGIIMTKTKVTIIREPMICKAYTIMEVKAPVSIVLVTMPFPPM